MLKNTLINASPVAAGSVRPKLTVINSPTPAGTAGKAPLAAIVNQFAKLGVQDILVIGGKNVDVHQIK